jgi:hypothetical protein
MNFLKTVCAVTLIFFLLSCSQKTNLLGKWTSDLGQSIEFFKDGTVVEVSLLFDRPFESVGSYTFLDATRFKISDGIVSEVYEYEVNGKSLTIKDSDGNATVYRKPINNPGAANTVKKYFNYISREEYEKAYNLLKDPFKASKGELVDYIAMFDRSRQHGTIYQQADIVQIAYTDRDGIIKVSFELNLREKGKQTKSKGTFLLEKDSTTNQWLIFDSTG